VAVVSKNFKLQTPTSLAKGYEGEAEAISWGQQFIANPDPPRRFEEGSELNEPQPETFYGDGPVGYTDYPFLDLQII